MQNSGKSEYIIQRLAGCGPFQAVLVILVGYVTKSAATFTMMLMAFGNYNPGWRCLDSTAITNLSIHNISLGFEKGSDFEQEEEEPVYDYHGCPVFESCKHVEFHPGTSTIVTEWNLLCEKGWISSFIISLQMAGLVVGSAIAGQLGDAFGRKRIIYVAQLLITILNVVSAFSTSWEMFACLRFLLGLHIAYPICLHYVYIGEYVPSKWRAPLPHIPTWSMSCVFFVVTAMQLKDWRQIHVATAVLAGIGILPVVWLPESLRWLETKNKTGDIERAVRKVARMNKKELPSFEDIQLEETNLNQASETLQPEQISVCDDKTYTYLDLFRPGYRMRTICLALPWFSMSLIMYSLVFGVKALSGNFYLNLVLPYASDISLIFIPMIAPNLLGRKRALIIFMGLTGVCLLLAASLHRFTEGYLRSTGVVVLATAGKVSTGFFWGVIMTYTVEAYPTVVRGLAQGFGYSLARAGGVAAPFLVPQDPGSFFTCYIAMGVLGIVCCLVISRLEETKGKALKDTFEDTYDNNRVVVEGNVGK